MNSKCITMKSISTLLKMAALAFFATLAFGCDEEDPSETFNHDDTSNYYGDWKRSNMESYVRFESSTAITCVGGQETFGTFNASEPSMTFVVGGETIKFPLQFDGDSMLVGVPDQAIDTHNAQVYYRSDNFPCDGGGGGGSGTGNVMFWISSDFGCGNISVTVNGYGGAITGYYNSSPDCGASGAANFTLPAGSYNFTASCSGYSWDGTVTVSEDSCYKMQLTL
ncbi:MAG: hypothetical protein CMP77_11120 [Flavobacterium sp.]|nr:hypothetical protein [Flavobacterium sp.]